MYVCLFVCLFFVFFLKKKKKNLELGDGMRVKASGLLVHLWH